MNPKGKEYQRPTAYNKNLQNNFFSLHSISYDAKHVLPRQEGVMIKWNCFPRNYRMMLKEIQLK